LKLIKGLPPLTCREIPSVFNARDFLVFIGTCPTIKKEIFQLAEQFQHLTKMR
jgi:hypothetical protein